MTSATLYGMFLSAGGGPAELMRDALQKQLDAFVAGEAHVVETAWTPAVRRTSARGEGEWQSLAFIWLKLERTPGGIVSAHVRIDARGGAFTTDAELMTRFGQVAIEVAALARMLNEVL